MCFISSSASLQKSSLVGVSDQYLHLQYRKNFKISKLYFKMACRKLSDAERWQAVGIVRGGMCYRQTPERFNVSHSVIVRLKQRVDHTGSVKEHQRTGRSLKTTPREVIFLNSLTRQHPFSTRNTLWRLWIDNGRWRTVNRRLNNERFHASRLIIRSLLTIRHKIARLWWEHDHMGWNIRSR